MSLHGLRAPSFREREREGRFTGVLFRFIFAEERERPAASAPADRIPRAPAAPLKNSGALLPRRSHGPRKARAPGRPEGQPARKERLLPAPCPPRLPALPVVQAAVGGAAQAEVDSATGGRLLRAPAGLNQQHAAPNSGGGGGEGGGGGGGGSGGGGGVLPRQAAGAPGPSSTVAADRSGGLGGLRLQALLRRRRASGGAGGGSSGGGDAPEKLDGGTPRVAVAAAAACCGSGLQLRPGPARRWRQTGAAGRAAYGCGCDCCSGKRGGLGSCGGRLGRLLRALRRLRQARLGWQAGGLGAPWACMHPPGIRRAGLRSRAARGLGGGCGRAAAAAATAGSGAAARLRTAFGHRSQLCSRGAKAPGERTQDGEARLLRACSTSASWRLSTRRTPTGGSCGGRSLKGGCSVTRGRHRGRRRARRDVAAAPWL